MKNELQRCSPGGTRTCFAPRTIAETSPSSTPPALPLLMSDDNGFGVRQLNCKVWLSRLAASDNQSSGMSLRYSEISDNEFPTPTAAAAEPDCVSAFPPSSVLDLTVHMYVALFLICDLTPNPNLFHLNQIANCFESNQIANRKCSNQIFAWSNQILGAVKSRFKSNCDLDLPITDTDCPMLTPK